MLDSTNGQTLRKLFLAAILTIAALIATPQANAQNSVSIGASQTLPKSVLTLFANGAQGFLPPQLSLNDTAAFGSLGSEYAGLLFFDTVGKSLVVYTGSQWSQLNSSSSSGSNAKVLLHQEDECFDELENSFDTIISTQIFIPNNTNQIELRFEYKVHPTNIQLKLFLNSEQHNATLPLANNSIWHSEVFNTSQTGWVDLKIAVKANTNPPGAEAEICKMKISAL